MIVLDPKFVWTQHLLDPDFFDPTFFGANFYDPTFFEKEKLFLTRFFAQNYLYPNKIDLKICGSKFFWTSLLKLTIFGHNPTFLSITKCLGLKTYWTPIS